MKVLTVKILIKYGGVIINGHVIVVSHNSRKFYSRKFDFQQFATVFTRERFPLSGILLGTNFVSAMQNREVPAMGGFSSTTLIISPQLGLLQVSTIWRCLLLGGVR